MKNIDLILKYHEGSVNNIVYCVLFGYVLFLKWFYKITVFLSLGSSIVPPSKLGTKNRNRLG